MIVVVLVSMYQPKTKEASFQESVIIALVQHPGTLEQRDSPIQILEEKGIFDTVSIATDPSIDTALQYIASKADEEFASHDNSTPATAPVAEMRTYTA